MPTRDEAWPAGTPCWIDAQVDDVAKAAEFYTQLFGWDVYDAGPDAGGYHMAYLQEKPVAGLGPKPEGSQMPGVWTTYFATDDVAATADKATAAGGSMVMPPMDVMTVGKMAIGADPAGAVYGLWQPLDHKGAGIVNEPGSLCWNELHTNDYKGAQAFYTALFGYTYAEVGDGSQFIYSVFTTPGASDSVGGMNDDPNLPPGHPPYWLTWFATADCDASTAKAKELGSTVFYEPSDSPFGRMSIVQGPQRETFGLIDMSRRVGEMPDPS